MLVDGCFYKCHVVVMMFGLVVFNYF